MTVHHQLTGQVTAETLVQPEGDARLAVYAVTFAPRARTHWHTHPRGQGLYVTEGEAVVQVDGEPPAILTAGESIWISAHQRHWHGATARAAMTHLAYQESDDDGCTVRWYDPVTETTYQHAIQENS